MTLIQLRAPLALATASGDPKSRRHVSGTAYSGAVASASKWGPVAINLATTTVNRRMPLLYEHETAEVLGVIDGANDGAQIRIDGELFTDIDAHAASLAAKSDAGLPLQMSVGLYDPVESYIPDGATIQLNGRLMTGPLRVLDHGTVREVSLCMLGADSQTSAIIFSTPPQKRTPPMDLAQLQAHVAELSTKAVADAAAIARLTGERDTALAERNTATAALTSHEAAVALAAAAAQKADVTATLAALGLAADEAGVAPYVGLSAASWGAVKASLQKLKQAPDAALFSEQADAGRIPDGAKSPLIQDAERRAAAAARK